MKRARDEKVLIFTQKNAPRLPQYKKKKSTVAPQSQNSLKIRRLRNPLQRAFFYVVRMSFGPSGSRGSFARPPGLDSAVPELPKLKIKNAIDD